MNEGTVVFDWVRPEPWPPKHPISMFNNAEGGTGANLVCFPDGHFAVIVLQDGQQREYHYQGVVSPSGSICEIQMEWGVGHAAILAGGEKLLTLQEANGRVLDAKVKGNVAYGMEQLSLTPEMLGKVSRIEWLFLETLGDVTRKLGNASRYELVRLSALLRQLLCDETPLVIAVSRNYNIKVAFQAAIMLKEPIAMPDLLQTYWRTLYPSSPEEAMDVDLERFLRLETIAHRGVRSSVRDIIAVVAHVLGGVHYGQTMNSSNRALMALDEVLLVNESMVLHSMFDIGRVTLKALIPLAKAVIAAYK